MKSVTIIVYGDGALFGGSISPKAHSRGYWMFSLYDTDDWVMLECEDVPDEIAERLCDHGTSDQYFDDGYCAMQAALPYVKYVVDCHDDINIDDIADEFDIKVY